MENNTERIIKIERMLDGVSPVRLGVNKKNELVRLLYEISTGKNIDPYDVIAREDMEKILAGGKGDFFLRIKSVLIRTRYPSIKKGQDPHLMPIKLQPVTCEREPWDHRLRPERIFVEKKVSGKDWTERFLSNFPGAEIRTVDRISEALSEFKGKDPLELYALRRDNVFLVEHRASFIKMCPCTKGCVRCGYWILNVGFGCPMDCSYCYLQTYSNAPGMVLPANIEDYFDHIEKFDKSAGKRTRIGTGEFTDSLAFDRYTGYSKYLIAQFKRAKNLILELKTKVKDIDTILLSEPNDNVVISWSINPENISGTYEKGSASVDERIGAALEAARKGYKVGFHFDPIVHYEGWEKDYEHVVNKIFSHEILRKNTVWVSLGTFRFSPGLNQIAEKRFEINDMYYQGEFFIDDDGKMRYSREVRAGIYAKMAKWIKKINPEIWVYLCMEFQSVWKKAGLEHREYHE